MLAGDAVGITRCPHAPGEVCTRVAGFNGLGRVAPGAPPKLASRGHNASARRAGRTGLERFTERRQRKLLICTLTR